MRRSLIVWAYPSAVAAGVIAINAGFRSYDSQHPDQLIEILFLMVASLVMSIPQAQIERGHLDLSSIVTGAAAMVANPIHATVVGLVASLGQARRGSWRFVNNGVMYAIATCLGSVVASQLRVGNSLAFGSRLLVVLTLSLTNVVVVLVGLRIWSGEPVLSILRHNFTPSFYAAFAYLGLAAILLSYVLDGTLTGYLLATIVCVLALALTDTIAGRRERQVLESELTDADRHLFHSRAVEGVVHNLRNHIATAVGYLREIEPRRLDPADRDNLTTATAAANDAVVVLQSLSQGATPRVDYSPNPVDLNELITRGLAMARPRARTKEVQLASRESAEDVRVRADPLLMREVITNLINNAIDAAPPGGHVTAMTGRRGGRPYFSVSDDGPGIPDERRHRLFEPHFTTKEGGTGLGLFMSYGIVREHQGTLSYEGDRHGAVFTVSLPPWSGLSS